MLDVYCVVLKLLFLRVLLYTIHGQILLYHDHNNNDCAMCMTLLVLPLHFTECEMWLLHWIILEHSKIVYRQYYCLWKITTGEVVSNESIYSFPFYIYLIVCLTSHSESCGVKTSFSLRRPGGPTQATAEARVFVDSQQSVSAILVCQYEGFIMI